MSDEIFEATYRTLATALDEIRILSGGSHDQETVSGRFLRTVNERAGKLKLPTTWDPLGIILALSTALHYIHDFTRGEGRHAHTDMEGWLRKVHATAKVHEEGYQLVESRRPYVLDENLGRYHCHRCQARDVKLWRDYQTFLENMELVCLPCLVETTDIIPRPRVEDFDQDGRRPCPDGHGRSDSLGWKIPAIITSEGDTFWGYTSVPPLGVRWWRRLPNLEPVAQYQVGRDRREAK